MYASSGKAACFRIPGGSGSVLEGSNCISKSEDCIIRGSCGILCVTSTEQKSFGSFGAAR